MTAQAALWAVSGSALAVAAASTVAERRRVKRRNLDAAGWMPWAIVQIIAFIAALGAAAAAMRS